MATALICSTDPVFREHIVRLLTEVGSFTCLTAATVNVARQMALDQLPGLLVMAHDPPEFDAVALTSALRKQLWVPVLFAAQTWSVELSKAAVAAGAAAFVSRFPGAEELSKAVFEAGARLEHDDLLRTKLRETEQRLADRKLIEKAKGLVMERDRISENEAFKRLRSQSMARRISMAILAEELVAENVKPGSPRTPGKQ